MSRANLDPGDEAAVLVRSLIVIDAAAGGSATVRELMIDLRANGFPAVLLSDIWKLYLRTATVTVTPGTRGTAVGRA